jgi:hypothetical protein
MAEYERLLEAAREGGYRWAFFDHEPREQDLFLRHDVDLSLEAALTMASLEAEMDAHATYFLMKESVFYNLDSPDGKQAQERLRELGHRVGLHAVWPRAEFDDRFDRVLAWHNPDHEYMSLPAAGAVNVMQPPWFDPVCYRSDSNQRWAHGSPREALARRELPWLQLLIHPEIWVYPGTTMRETMLAFLDADREARLTHLAHDRIDLS